MSFRRIFSPPTCKSLRSASTLTARTPYRYQYEAKDLSLRTCGQRRGAKTRTVVQASSLPQGPLPSLPGFDNGETPAKAYPRVLQQHLDNVRKFDDCVVLTRVGDFYEMYFDQVDQFAHQVNLKRAKRGTALGDVAMAGFQYTQLERYLKMFVQDLGQKVAISEQFRLPDGERSAKGGGPLYDRKVTRVITAGTLVDETFMDPYENNYLLAVHLEGRLPTTTVPNATQRDAFDRYKRSTKIGLSWVDLSSGAFFTQASDLASLPSLVARIGPREIVLNSSMLGASEQSQINGLLGQDGYSLHYHTPTTEMTSAVDWTPMLERALSDGDAEAFIQAEIVAGSLVLDYIRNKLIDIDIKLQTPFRRSDDEYMAIDKQSLRGLEIRTTLRDGAFQGSLLHSVRRTVTKSGARLLSQRLVSPSMSLSVINNRLDLVQEMLQHDALREDVIALLKRTADTYRLLQRFSIGKGDADDLLSLARTVDVMVELSGRVYDHIVVQEDPSGDHNVPPQDMGFMWDMLQRLDIHGPAKVAKSIQSAINEESVNKQHNVDAELQEEAQDMAEDVAAADDEGREPPKLKRKTSRSSVFESTVEDIWIMRQSASPTLQRAHADLEGLLDAKSQLAQRLRSRLRAESLSLKWSAQLGHFCHIKGKDTQGTLASMEGARTIASTKSTRSFYLSDWTHLGVRIDDSKLRIRTEENRVFAKLRAEVIQNLMKLRRNAAVLDEFDVACSSAILTKERDLVRPIVNDSKSHRIIGGRHPTVDVGLRTQGRTFTANDCTVGDPEKIYLITGPNMAGKSTYLRQNALITILAQTGSFVPADYAEIGLVDKIFSRVGSADNLYQDQSTFMVEMLETAEILKQATPRSFVVMDEVGRGTTPEDGVAVGYACLYHLHYVNQSRTLFATHFHALADMMGDFESLACYCTDVAEEDDGAWSYVHKLTRGVNRQSHALKVARLAGVPQGAIDVAAGVLASLGSSSVGRRNDHDVPKAAKQ